MVIKVVEGVERPRWTVSKRTLDPETSGRYVRNNEGLDWKCSIYEAILCAEYVVTFGVMKGWTSERQQSDGC